MKERETFGSRLGFILVSAGCAIGLGNVWKFPYMAGKYGGAAFILIYLIFLVLLGLPVLVCEFAVGRASRKSTARAFHDLEPEGANFHNFSYMSMVSNYVLMMFYYHGCRMDALLLLCNGSRQTGRERFCTGGRLFLQDFRIQLVQ